jgi:hypothetical protein
MMAGARNKGEEDGDEIVSERTKRRESRRHKKTICCFGGLGRGRGRDRDRIGERENGSKRKRD